MLQFLRWATFVVLGCVIIGAALSYPLLRQRFIAPALTASPSALEKLAGDDATANPVSSASPAARPTLRPTPATATVPAVIIQAPSPTAPPVPNQATDPVATP